MNRFRLFLLPLVCLLAFSACKDDDDNQGGNFVNTNKMRVKRIEGENTRWGKYVWEFSYRTDGRLESAVRLDPNVTNRRDTVGMMFVEYDVDFHKFTVYDRVMRIDLDSINKLKELYPDTYQDTLLQRRTSVTLYSTQLENGQFVAHTNRPRRSNGSGSMYNPQYVNVSAQTQMLEVNEDGQPLVIRCYDDVYGAGGENGKYERTVCKYEFLYEGKEMVSGISYRPDSYSESSWTKLKDLSFSYYSGILVSVDSDFCKMRRSGDKVVVAEPGRNITYTLNAEGLAVKLETTDGDTAVISYEEGPGNFAELYATPLDRALGKVWVK